MPPGHRRSLASTAGHPQSRGRPRTTRRIPRPARARSRRLYRGVRIDAEDGYNRAVLAEARFRMRPLGRSLTSKESSCVSCSRPWLRLLGVAAVPRRFFLRSPTPVREGRARKSPWRARSGLRSTVLRRKLRLGCRLALGQLGLMRGRVRAGQAASSSRAIFRRAEAVTMDRHSARA
jgi:hypothetical protein